MHAFQARAAYAPVAFGMQAVCHDWHLLDQCFMQSAGTESRLIVRVTHRHEGSGLPELGQGSRLKATGTAYGSTRACDELTTAIACVDSRREGLPLALSKARVAQGTW